MADRFAVLKRDEVVDNKTFAKYCQQQMGYPPVSGKNIPLVSKRIKAIFEVYPYATYFTLTRMVDWAREKSKRCADTGHLLNCYRMAYVDGYLADLDPRTDTRFEEKVATALRTETDRQWENKLLGCLGPPPDYDVYDEWLRLRGKKAV